MAGSITQTICTSLKVEVLGGVHNFNAGGNAFKIALYPASTLINGVYGPATTNYSQMVANSDENTGTGYTAGGITLTNSGISSGGTTAFTSWSNVTWGASTITSFGALIYNSTQANRTVAILAFGSNISSSAGNFTITFPSNDQNNAIIRLV